MCVGRTPTFFYPKIEWDFTERKKLKGSKMNTVITIASY